MTLVRINWYWFILPVVVECLSVGFFVWLLVCNGFSNARLWKGSLVAALYHSMDVRRGEGGERGMEGLFDMELVAEKMAIELLDVVEGGGVRSRLVRKQTSL